MTRKPAPKRKGRVWAIHVYRGRVLECHGYGYGCCMYPETERIHVREILPRKRKKAK